MGGEVLIFAFELILLVILCFSHEEFPYKADFLKKEANCSLWLIGISIMGILLINFFYFKGQIAVAIKQIGGLGAKCSLYYHKLEQNYYLFRTQLSFCMDAAWTCLVGDRQAKAELREMFWSSCYNTVQGLGIPLDDMEAMRQEYCCMWIQKTANGGICPC